MNLKVEGYILITYDVPVKIIIWTRKDCLIKQLEVIKKVKPEKIFLVSDGGRNAEEQDIINENRRLYEEQIDWECDLVKVYSDANLGMYEMGRRGLEIVWSQVDRCITLEDDVIPTESFFYFCREMLEKYKNDTRISMVCGMNHLGCYDRCTADYFFSREVSIWGFAMWKRTYELYFKPISKDPYMISLLKENTLHKNGEQWRNIKALMNGNTYAGHPAGAEFYIAFSYFAYNQLKIIPKKNLVSNWGCTKESAHSTSYFLLPHAVKKLYYMQTYELDFPLRDPEYIIDDVYYANKVKRMNAKNMPIVRFSRKIERWILTIKYGVFFDELKRMIGKRMRQET